MDNPLVTVIALNYNQSPYIEEAFLSLVNQTYKNIQIIIADDASTDNSIEIIAGLTKGRNDILFLPNSGNIGNCRTFNNAMNYARGKYIIDFALDDVLLPEMIEVQVNAFESLPDNYSVVFGDAVYIDQFSNTLKGHHKRDESGNLIEKVPSGNIYTEIIRRYFIAPPSVMVKRSFLQKLGGYDETLAYEDFDLWIRASRISDFYFLDRILVKKRVLSDSLSAQFNRKHNKMVLSTFRICQKINWLNRYPEEKSALIERIHYEMRHAWLVAHFDLVNKYMKMLKDLDSVSFRSILISKLASTEVDVYNLYRLYLKLRY
jgi:glycosyltransferase involved in cell wall biosynthesis